MSTEARKIRLLMQLRRGGIGDTKTLAAIEKIPRDAFTPPSFRDQAYENIALPIGQGQTLSQPQIVAMMTEALKLNSKHRVLEIGTGSGYQAAVLSGLVKRVYSIEIVGPLATRSKKKLKKLGYHNVTVIHGDGYRGLPAHAPFDGIIVTAAPEKIPKPLVEQLAVGGKMVIPVGGARQELRVLEKTKSGIVEKKIFDVLFVPMTGEARKSIKAPVRR